MIWLGVAFVIWSLCGWPGAGLIGDLLEIASEIFSGDE